MNAQDLRIWHYLRNGIFSVRSAYHLACTLENQPCSSSLHQNEHSWWSKLWQTKLPNKIKVFIWRACLSAIPTGVGTCPTSVMLSSAVVLRVLGMAKKC
ncbi:UNVERIFIED_CONTAM: hypothetical protein Scaly_0094900 [Sesamum calycinum]|uniref:Reverse transcriptase zinc-binding domain-containing protein n=1 Tax=Sesamum calycinum TaxID=2727403 RepID=A0AAW2SWF9_9LAMI